MKINEIKLLVELKDKVVTTKTLEDIIRDIKEVSYPKSDNLKQMINNIRVAFVRNWEKENLPHIERLISTIDLEAGVPLPILSICGQGTQEIRFTEYLSYFLDPNNNHGLQDKLLRVFIGPECKVLKVEITSNSVIQVMSEFNLGKIKENGNAYTNNVDIAIEGEDFIVILEQKILSSESYHPKSEMGQLERYSVALDDNQRYKNKRKVKIYLTPNEISKTSNHGWLYLTHDALIERGIELLRSEELSKNGKHNLTRLLLDLATGPYEKVEESLNETILLAKQLNVEKLKLSKFFRYTRLLEENARIIEILMEG